MERITDYHISGDYVMWRCKCSFVNLRTRIQKLFISIEICSICKRKYEISKDNENIIIEFDNLKVENIKSEKAEQKNGQRKETAKIQNKKLFHFTDARNLESIKRHGLLSWSQLEVQQIMHFPSSSELSRLIDKHKGLEDYVRLCLNEFHKMEYIAREEKRVEEIVWLMIDPSILNRETNLYSNINAAHNSAVVNSDINNAFSSGHDQAEVLVKNKIETKYILNIGN